MSWSHVWVCVCEVLDLLIWLVSDFSRPVLYKAIQPSQKPCLRMEEVSGCKSTSTGHVLVDDFSIDSFSQDSSTIARWKRRQRSAEAPSNGGIACPLEAIRMKRRETPPVAYVKCPVREVGFAQVLASSPMPTLSVAGGLQMRFGGFEL